eukprot:SAG11_NODE_52_length_19809_cov_14.064231_6_plen_484_part_00
MLLVTRNISAIEHFLPMLHRMSGFMEGRRVQDSSPLTPNSKGLFRAGNGANLLAPGFGGWPLPVGCIVNKTFSNCTQRSMSYLSELTVTYSALLDRMIQLEQLLHPNGGHVCSHPNADAKGPSECLDLYKARRAVNEASLVGILATMDSTGSVYLIRAMDPNGEKHGVYAPRSRCPVDEPCPLAARHGYFESAPNHDIVGLRVASDDLAQSIYMSMISIDGLRPCDFTIPNFPGAIPNAVFSVAPLRLSGATLADSVLPCRLRLRRQLWRVRWWLRHVGERRQLVDGGGACDPCSLPRRAAGSREQLHGQDPRSVRQAVQARQSDRPPGLRPGHVLGAVGRRAREPQWRADLGRGYLRHPGCVPPRAVRLQLRQRCSGAGADAARRRGRAIATLPGLIRQPEPVFEHGGQRTALDSAATAATAAGVCQLDLCALRLHVPGADGLLRGDLGRWVRLRTGGGSALVRLDGRFRPMFVGVIPPELV